MPPTEPNRPVDQADVSRFAEVRLRFQKVHSERMLKQVAQLEEQRNQMKLDISRLVETVEGASIGRVRQIKKRPDQSLTANY